MHLKLMTLALALLAAAPAPAQHTGRAAGHLGAQVMPFDLVRSLHVFTPTPRGGMQEVISRDGDAAQVRLIQAHLRHEADAFARGDYADPMAIHGTNMPGVESLRQGADRVRVSFELIRQGARIRFETADPRLVTAVQGVSLAYAMDGCGRYNILNTLWLRGPQSSLNMHG